MTEYTDEELIWLLSKLAMVDATGETNGVPRLGIAGASEALTLMIDFFTEKEK
jgi:hypothetical protein